MKKVMAFGSFDMFHEGHKAYLQQAKAFGDYLIVIVSKSNSIKKIKKQEPWFDEEKRVQRVFQEPYVDEAITGYDDDFLRIVIEEQPNILCLGYDQRIDEKELRADLEKRGFNDFEIKRAKAFHPDKFKSSILKKQHTSKKD